MKLVNIKGSSNQIAKGCLLPLLTNCGPKVRNGGSTGCAIAEMRMQGQAPLTNVPPWDSGWPFASNVTTTSFAAPCFAQLSVLTSGQRSNDETELRRRGGQAVAQRIRLHVKLMRRPTDCKMAHLPLCPESGSHNQQAVVSAKVMSCDGPFRRCRTRASVPLYNELT